MRSNRRFLGRMVWLGALAVLSGAAIASRAGDEAAPNQAVSELTVESAPEGFSSPVEQVTTEILQLRESVGSAWRGDTFSGAFGSPTEDDTLEIVRTALLEQADALSPLGQPEISPTSAGQKPALREAAHQLDLTAHLLECQELYERADQLRAMAQELRQQARDTAPPVFLEPQNRFSYPAQPSADN